MQDRHRRRVTLLVVIIVGVTLIPPILFGEAPTRRDQTGGDPWRNVIEDFQTLITGFFAVAAAFITVQTMWDTDREQAKRHRQSIHAAKQDEILAVKHFDFYVAGPMRIHHARIQQFISAWDLRSRNEVWTHVAQGQFLVACAAAGAVRRCFQYPQFEKMQQLFEPQLMADFGICNSYCQIIDEDSEQRMVPFDALTSEQHWSRYDMQYQDNLRELSKWMAKALKEYERWKSAQLFEEV